MIPPSKPATPAPAVKEDIVSRTATYEIATSRRGNWLVVSLRGTYSDPVVETLRKDLFTQKTSFAIDTSLMSGFTVTLVREFWFVANQLKTAGDTRLVLINPPEKIRSLLSLIAPGAKLATFQGPEELPAEPKFLEQHQQKVEAEHAEIRKSLSTNPLWQFVDREACWLCCFCGKVLDDVKVVSRVSIPQPMIEKVYRHIHHRCPNYSPVSPKFLPAAQLEETLKHVNDEKFAASKSHAASLETKVRQLADKAQWADSMEASMKLAVDRQKRLLPAKPPTIPGVEVAITYRPASHVSGDFYDFIDMGEGRVGFSIGDVAGHGIEAGILMGMTKKVINIRASELLDVAAALKKTNNDVYKELDRQTFVTAFLGMLDPTTRRFTYARAGHNPPLLFNKGRTPTLRKLDAGGLMLGMSQGAIFERAMTGETVELQAGDIILLYTDGLEEAKNDKGELFGTGRMAKVIEKECDRPPNFILGALSFELDRFVGTLPAEDDVTCVCIKAQ